MGDADQRAVLINDPPRFQDRVDSPWNPVPDHKSYNEAPFRRITWDLDRLARDRASFIDGGAAPVSNSMGCLVLGEAGCGKTHLLMRLARERAQENLIVFVRRPNNREVALHVWGNVLASLNRSIGHQPSQLEALLVHAFSSILVRVFTKDVEAGRDVDTRRRWITRLQTNPWSLLELMGRGDTRQRHLTLIRNAILAYVRERHANADPQITHALVSYCLYTQANRRRLLHMWLLGQEIPSTEANQIGLPPTWALDTSPQPASLQERALSAIQTLGVISLYYRPIILAFDQLEGLRHDVALTARWGDTVREIFTMTPNMLVLTCIFPSLWSSWFEETLDDAARQRIAQRTVSLEALTPDTAVKLLQAHLADHVARHRLPSLIYPFRPEVAESLARGTTAPRIFLQRARDWFEAWLDDEAPPALEPGAVVDGPPADAKVREALLARLDRSVEQHAQAYQGDVPDEHDFIGRLRLIVSGLVATSADDIGLGEADLGAQVMPANFVLRPSDRNDWLCLAVLFRQGIELTSRAGNLLELVRDGGRFQHLIVVRDARCSDPSGVAQEHLDAIEADTSGAYVRADRHEVAVIHAIYDLLVAVEEREVSVDEAVVTPSEAIRHLRDVHYLRRSAILNRIATMAPSLRPVIGD